MNWEAIGAVGELLAALGVIVTLAYLAIQIRQNTRFTRASMSQSVVAEILGINLACAQDPELARAYGEGMENLESLSEADQRRVAHIFFGLFKLFESMFYQRQQFTMEPQYWQGWRALMLSYYARPGLRRWWQLRREVFSDDFRSYVEAQKLDQPPMSPSELVRQFSPDES